MSEPANGPDPLGRITAEIHKLERSSIFEIGALLNQAKEATGHGEWQKWFAESDFSD